MSGSENRSGPSKEDPLLFSGPDGLIVLPLRLEIGLGMLAGGAQQRSLLGLDNEAAVAALPPDLAVALEEVAVREAAQQLQVAAFVLGLHRRDHLERRGDLRESLLFGDLAEFAVQHVPLLVLALGGSQQVLGRRADGSGGVAGRDLHVAALEELEETLILSDIGAVTSANICEALRKEVKATGTTDPAEVKGLLKKIIAGILEGENELILDTKPTVILVIGVNGAGKTTTIGKLAYNLKSSGKKVVVAAADTFRAAAIEQLEVWTQRAGVDIIKHSEGSVPAAVVFDAVKAGIARDADVIICDTAGRLHNKKNLMDELKKIARIVNNNAPDSRVETLLVLDATTGQNAVNQARLFKETADITGIVLTKLDGTAKGGIIIPIKEELGIPVKLVGVGEKIDDLQPFVPRDYVEALFE